MSPILYVAYFCPIPLTVTIHLVCCRMLSSEAAVSKEEEQIRKDEAALFSRLSEPPKVVDSLAYLLEQKEQNAEQQNGKNGKKTTK